MRILIGASVGLITGMTASYTGGRQCVLWLLIGVIIGAIVTRIDIKFSKK